MGNPRQNDPYNWAWWQVVTSDQWRIRKPFLTPGLSQWKGWRWLGGGFKYFLYFHPYLTNIFQMGWNHQLDDFSFNRDLSKQKKKSDLMICFFSSALFISPLHPQKIVKHQKNIFIELGSTPSPRIPVTTRIIRSFRFGNLDLLLEIFAHLGWGIKIQDWYTLEVQDH